MRSFRAAAFLAAVSIAGANTIFQLDRDACTGSCGTGPFANITLEQTTASMVTVTEELAPNVHFARTGAGQALEFNGPGALVIANLTPGFVVGPSPAKASAFGAFMYSVTCAICQGGKATNPSGPLSFTVTSANGVTIADFGPNPRGFYFASDIRGNNGKTGNVAAVRSAFLFPEAAAFVVDAPEPVGMVLIGSGLVGLGLWRRRSGLRT